MSSNIKFSLTAIEAKELLSADSNGLSDPYFKIPHPQRGVVDLPKKKNRTKTIMKTLNPVWNHTFEMEFDPRTCTKLNIEVYDYDYIGRDDLIGTGEIPLDWMFSGQQDIFEQWIPLKVTVKDKKKKTSQVMQKGSVHVKLQVRSRPAQQPGMYQNQPPRQMSQPPYMQQQQMNQPPYMQQQQMSQPPYMQQQQQGHSPYIQQQPQGQPPNMPQQMNQPPNIQPQGQPPNIQQQMSQPPNIQQQQPQGQPPNMQQQPQGQPPNMQQQPSSGQPPNIQQQPQVQPPNMQQQPQGQPPNEQQPPMEEQADQYPSLEQVSNLTGQASPEQLPVQPPPGEPPVQPPQGQPPMGQPPVQPPQGQPPLGQPPVQPPQGQPPLGQPPIQPPQGQPPMGQPPIQPPQGQPPMGQPPVQPPQGQPPVQPPPGQTPIQPPPGQPPIQPPPGQPSVNQPQVGQSPVNQPPIGQMLHRQATMAQPPIPHPNMVQVNPLMRQHTLQPVQNSMMPRQQPTVPIQNTMLPPNPPGQYSMMPPHPAGMPGQYSMMPQNPYGAPVKQPMFQNIPPTQQSMYQPHPYGQPAAPYYPQQYSQPPTYPHGMMQRPMTAPVMPAPMYAPHGMSPPMMQPGVQIINHRRGDALMPGAWIPVREPTVLVGLGWDFTGYETFDLDASLVGFDPRFNVVDTIYFNHKRGLNGSVIHYGDNTTGEGEGDDEIIQVDLHRIPRNVQYLAVTLNSFKKNSLIIAKSAYIRIYTRSYHIGKYLLTRTKDCIGLLLGVFERSQDPYCWYFRVMADPIHGNKVTLSYEDIKTLLGSYSISNCPERRIVHPLPGEPLIEFNKWIKLPNRFLYVGLGWNIQQGQNYDLDASILTFDRMNNLMEMVYHKNLRSYNGSIIHYGDNRTGAGEGDDEVLSVDFGHVDPNTFTMAVVINSFKGNSMNYILDAFIRIYDPQRPIGVHVLNKCPDCIGLCLGLFRKDTNGVWSFCAIKEIVNGIECTQSINDVIFLLNKYPLN